MVEIPNSVPGAEAAERVLKSLSKLVSGRKIYADNNPRLEQFRDELATSLGEFFASLRQTGRWQHLCVPATVSPLQ